MSLQSRFPLCDSLLSLVGAIMVPLSLSQRLFLVTAVAVLPTVVILALNLVTLRDDAERRLREEAWNSAKIASLEMNRIVGGIQSLLLAVSKAPVVQLADEGCNLYLTRVTEATPQLSDMAVADAQGNVVCRSSMDRTPLSIADRDYFSATRLSNNVVTGTYTVGRISGRATLPVALGLGPDSAWPGGVIAGGLDLAWLGSRLKERDFVNDNALTIADSTGRIIAREPMPEKFVGTQIPDRYAFLVRETEPGTLPVISQDGTRRVIGYFPPSVEGSGLYVSAGISTGTVYAATNRLMLQGTLVALAGIIAALILARFTSNYFISQPFGRLIATIEAWQREEMDTRTGMGTQFAEFGRAGRALDQFMDQLTAARAARREAERQREVLVNELDHRVKNIVATIQAVARQTFRGSGLDGAVRVFSQRLHAMATAHKVLMSEGWKSALISTVIAETTAPFRDPHRNGFVTEGVDVQLGSKAVMGLSMALHELCTNAVKYGALGSPTGQVSIAWGISEGTFHLSWTESGGPPVTQPTARGFGSAMIEQILAHQLGGMVLIEYLPGGLVCRVSAPVASVLGLSHDIDPASAPLVALQT